MDIPRGKPILICAQQRAYGLYLNSLVRQLGVETQLVRGQDLDRDLLERTGPLLTVVEAPRDEIPAVFRSRRRETPGVLLVAECEDGAAGRIEKRADCTVFFKPIHPEKFTRCVWELLSNRVDTGSVRPLCEPYLIGNSPAMEEVRRTIAKISATDLTVLIGGETGTGKGLVALAIHNNSPRRSGPFLEVNCANIPSSLLESELFGYKKGAFTGAWGDKPGKFDLADSGTLFLDEISEMVQAMQAKLLQVLQDGEYSPIGSVENKTANVRIISATNAALEQLVEQGRFRNDLYYRLKVITLHLPPLRARKEDIGPLREHFLEKYALLYDKKPHALSKDFCSMLEEHDWPGNVRELENVIKSVVALGSESLALEGLQRTRIGGPAREKEEDPALEFRRSIRHRSLREISQQVAERAERKAIEEALAHTQGNKKAAARLLQVSYKGLLGKIKAYGL
ncbi:two-component system, NtrC family, response regulator AtoC [Desulfacinum hydrothermale DSM 13146]|uniref:Two-component system, NtrC family, response regulator AtoC n=1 Tax=Desulfacinum hydrothermale DSM 13146 TaxID=1121390 RepID=A0A1W1XRC8_9BACT|nr:sigma 54-interacting transcriptional regulator [Desulfacinum hydrothermale]SMC26412.1 two-component system, NtrC family, response regulator AtoC [Desulfacinum hydrothermale DSM 13146]